MADEDKALSHFYAEFTDEDKKLAEVGLADYAALGSAVLTTGLEAEEREDGQFFRLLDTLTIEERLICQVDVGTNLRAAM
jgi:hypothetical protein